MVQRYYYFFNFSMKKIFFSILITSLAITGLFAQKKVTPLPVDSTFAYGKEYIIYALPQTAFQVNVTVTRSHEFAGVYSQYAGKLLGLNNVISSDNIFIIILFSIFFSFFIYIIINFNFNIFNKIKAYI